MFQRLFCLLLFVCSSAWAQQQLEVIPLRSQTVDKVLPVLLPLVEPGGSLSGMNNQLFLRASPRNREEIKRALAAIDTPARRLIIRVSQNRQAEIERRGASGSAQVTLGSTRRVEAGAQVWDTRSVRRDSGEQSVQTLEGASAFIQIGRSLAIPLRQVVIGPGGVVASETTVFRDVGQGFYAIPRLAGDRVTLDISQQADAAGPGGSVATQRLSTTVSGRLGEWIELGGGGRRAAAGDRSGVNLSTQDVSESRSVWLQVEEVP